LKNEKRKKVTRLLRDPQEKVLIAGVLLLVLLAAVVVVLPMFRGGDALPQIELGTVTFGSITETIDSYGTLEAQPSTTLIWNSDGVVGEFDLKVGDKVEKGDVLIELEPSSQSASILNAYNDLLEAQNDLDLLIAADSEYQSVLSDLVYQEKMLI
jgi:multidrug efflux pump subunit AcrA (membrane-fusion protein)